MKRSQMIDLIVDKILEGSLSYTDVTAEAILTMMENEGMVLRTESMGCGDPNCCEGDSYGFDSEE